MSRHKLSDDVKKPKISVTLNKELDSVLQDYITDNNLNRSKYIEDLIKSDMLSRGYKLKQNFEKQFGSFEYFYYLYIIKINKNDIY